MPPPSAPRGPKPRREPQPQRPSGGESARVRAYVRYADTGADSCRCGRPRSRSSDRGAGRETAWGRIAGTVAGDRSCVGGDWAAAAGRALASAAPRCLRRRPPSRISQGSVDGGDSRVRPPGGSQPSHCRDALGHSRLRESRYRVDDSCEEWLPRRDSASLRRPAGGRGNDHSPNSGDHRAPPLFDLASVLADDAVERTLRESERLRLSTRSRLKVYSAGTHVTAGTGQSASACAVAGSCLSATPARSSRRASSPSSIARDSRDPGSTPGSTWGLPATRSIASGQTRKSSSSSMALHCTARTPRSRVIETATGA